MNSRKTIIITIICFVAFIILGINATFYEPKSPSLLSKGTLSYTTFPFDDSTTYSINEFFYKDASSSTYNSDDYKLSMIFPEDIKYIALRIPLVYSYVTITANNNLVYTANESKTSELTPPLIIIIPVVNNMVNLEMKVQKSKFLTSLAYSNPVNTNDMIIGTSVAVYNHQKKVEIVNYFVVISCLFFSMYHIMISLYRKNKLLHIFLSLFSFSIAICLFTNNQAVIHYFIPSITAAVSAKIYLSFSFIKILSLIGYLYNYFEYNPNSKPYTISMLLPVILFGLSILMPFNHLSFLYLINIAFTVIVTIFFIYTLIISRDDYKILSYTFNLTGILALQYGLYTEYLFLFGPHSYFSHYSIAQLLFVLIYTLGFSKKFNDSLLRIHTLSPELQKSLNELQNNPSTYINTHIKPDFLYETLYSVEHYIDTDTDKVDKLIQALSKYLRQALDFSINPTKYSLKKELDNCAAYAALVNEQQPSIKFIFNIDEKLKDTLIPQQAILSVMENSVANAFTGILQPTVTITAKQSEDNQSVFISIKDNGVGMTEDEIEYALNVSSPNLDISLFYINNQLKENFESQLIVTSQRRSGTSVSFTVPITEVEIYE